MNLINSPIAGKAALTLQKHAPAILTFTGLASMTAGAFLAVRATTKLEPALAKAEARVVAIKEDESNTDKKVLYRAYMVNALEFSKLYGPAVSMFIAGGASIIAGHGILQKRNVALTAAYNAVAQSFAAYRARVIEDLGEEKDRDYRMGITETSEPGENGKKQTITEVDPTKMSQYARVFDEGNPNWQNGELYNQFFLTAEQNWFNDLLLARGHVFLNEVYDRLGFKRTQAGSVVGWKLKEGDNYIDFGIYDASTQAKRNFVNGYEKSIWLDFNVDGVIFDKL